MAATKKRTRAASTRSKSTRSGRGSSKSKISITGSLYELMTMTFFGRSFLVMIICVILAGINILISGNRYDFFYVLCGIELILIVIIGWLRLLLRPEN